jgi:hypothetical protein
MALAISTQAATRNVTATTVVNLHKWVDSADKYTNNTYNIQLSAQTYVITKTLKLTKGKANLKGSTTLTNAGNYIIEGGFPNISGAKRVVHVEGASGWYPGLGISGITIRGGYATTGAGIYGNNSGSISIVNSYIRNNMASSWGSGIYVGTGISVNLLSSVVRGNINFQSQSNSCGGVTAGGGGLAVFGGVFSSYQSTFMENQACRGAGAAIYSGFASFENSTFSSNNANKRGGGIYIEGSPFVGFRFNTIAYNKAGVYSADPSGFVEQKYGGGIAMLTFTGNLFFFGNILAKNQTVNSDKAILGSHGNDCFRKSPGTPNYQHMDNLIGDIGNCTAIIGSGAPFQGSETTPVDPLLDPNLTL